MAVNHNVNPRPLTAEEKENRARGVYDSFATYVVFCGHCRYVRKTNMYIMRAEAFIDELKARGEVCPQCGRQEWTLGYPMGTTTGFVKFYTHTKRPPAVAWSLRHPGVSGSLCVPAGAKKVRNHFLHDMCVEENTSGCKES